jgi:putative ABC transport system permease protein
LQDAHPELPAGRFVDAEEFIIDKRNLFAVYGFYHHMARERRIEALAHDVRYALRSLRRNRTFTVVAVVALALGIGAGTAVFSVVDRILFRSLPYPQAGRLVSVGMVAPIVPQEFLLSYDYLDWRDSQKPFESMGSWVYSLRDCDLNDTRPVRLRCVRVDSTLLRTLGIDPLLGRNFTRQEETPNAPKSAIISYGLWRSRFSKDPAAVGQAIRLDGQSVRIVGVLPPQFELPTLEAADILVPQVLDEPEQRSRRLAILTSCVARLKPGVSQSQAAVELHPLFEQSLEAVTPSFRKDVKLFLRPLRDRQVQDSRLASWVLLGSVLAVLLIACANVANLLLARAAAREREFAVRAALGAGRWRLVRQTFTESTLLALTGGAAGCGLAFALLRFFIAIAPEGIPRLHQAGLDVRVLMFTLLLSLVCGILFGLAPALQIPRMETLAAGRSQVGGRLRFRQCLVAVQICVSLVLLAGASLLLRSLWNLQHQPLGIRADHVLTAAVTLGRTSYPAPAQRLAFFEEMEQRLRRIPGIADLALAESLPPTGNSMGSMLYAAIDVRGRPQFTDGTGGPVEWRAVTPRYFSVLGIPMLQGRPFREEDRDPDRNVIILSDMLARRLFPGENPVGKQIRPGRRGEWFSVIGVAANVRNSGLVESNKPEYYVLRKHSPENMTTGATAIIRTAVPPQALAKPVLAEIAALDPTLPVNIDTMDQRVSKLAERPRFNALLLGIFASVGMLLAAIGLYGVISFLVAQRAQEIGVRMALGATPGAIARMVLGRAALWTTAGAALGAVGSLFAVRLLSHMLFHVSAKDPWTFAAAVAMLLAVAFAAAWIPSRRAAHLDPMRVLRRE